MFSWLRKDFFGSCGRGRACADEPCHLLAELISQVAKGTPEPPRQTRLKGKGNKEGETSDSDAVGVPFLSIPCSVQMVDRLT